MKRFFQVIFTMLFLGIAVPPLFAHETLNTPCETIDISDQQFVEDLTKLRLENEALRNQVGEFEQRLSTFASQIPMEEDVALPETELSNDATELKKMFKEAKRVLLEQGKTIETLDQEREALSIEVNGLRGQQEESSGELKEKEERLKTVTVERDQLKQEVDKLKK